MMIHDYITYSYLDGAYLLMIYNGEVVARSGVYSDLKEGLQDKRNG